MATAAAQQPIRLIELRTEGVVAEAPAEPTPTPTAAAPADDPAAKEASEKLKLWTATKFDRRPSTVLATWAKPEPGPYDPKAEAEAEAKKRARDGAKPAEAAAPAPEATIPDPVIPEGTSAEDAQKMRDEVEKQRAAAAEQKAKAEAEALRQKERQREVEIAARDVTLGRWDRVGAFVQSLAEADRGKAYDYLLKGLVAPPPDPKAQQVPPPLQEKNVFAFEDVLALGGIAPGRLSKEQTLLLVPLLQRALDNGNVLESLLALMQQETQRPEGQRRLSQRQCALLLAAIDQDVELGPFLPTLAAAEAADDREGLNLLARHFVALHQKDQKLEHLERAWEATQLALAQGEVDDEQKDEALRRAIELAPKVRADLGPTWLVQSFTERPERGMEIVATIGAQAAQAFRDKPQDMAFRKLGLQLQRAAVDALFQSAPDLAEEWRPVLAILARNWIAEASWSYTNSKTTTMRPRLRRDAFGNLFYDQGGDGGGPVPAIEPNELLDARPSEPWIALLDDSLVPHLATVTAQLFLKINEDAQAFPFIERLAATNPRKAKELADEFLRVWMRNHNPNQTQNTDVYMFIYGFDRRASGIPLTRSKQERNLAELAGWVRRLRALPIEGVDEELLGQAFRTAHSTAEVYRLETIEQVFGKLGDQDPLMLAELLATMRTNLATIWRQPAVQEDAKTKRSNKDIEREVIAGYGTALQVAEQAMQQHARHWALLSAQASLLHDLNNFRQELKADSGFAEARLAAFALFEEAARNYAAAVPDLRLDQETTRVFETWFYGAVGACDLGAIDEFTVLADSQLPKIQAALQALPDGARERHLARFASLIFTRMSAVRAQVKSRYLEAAFAIVGDHPQAYEAKKVYDYYKDLTAEIALVARVDGPAEVGTAPFGMFVDLEHTVEIERESGGFNKYLQNQNNMQYAYNYGRPTENYRDKFHEAAAQALGDHFELLSVTFNADTATSISLPREGWRKTPYAYLLLRAKGPQVDVVPTMKLDLDFLDTSGYVVLPIGSAPVPIDAAHAAAAPRPFRDVRLTQVLDERKAEDGKLVLEVKAQGKGLMPALPALADLAFDGFDVAQVDDQDVSVSKFTEDQQDVESDRTWMVTLKATPGTGRPAHFHFATVHDAVATPVYQRYADADLQTVSAEVDLLSDYGHRAPLWPWLLGALGALLLAGGAWMGLRRRGGEDDVRGALHLPEHLTPFTVLVLLRRIAAAARLDDQGSRELAADMAAIERHWFAKGAAADGDAPDLRGLAERWLRRAG